jgi:hypothetical protein
MFVGVAGGDVAVSNGVATGVGATVGADVGTEVETIAVGFVLVGARVAVACAILAGMAVGD